jgi:AbrB family looped-hinge helix DNA binding protein
MSEIALSSVTSKGQITIPKEIREIMGLGEGDRIVFEMRDRGIYFRKVARRKLSDLLIAQGAWREGSVKFQRRMRQEWRKR